MRNDTCIHCEYPIRNGECACADRNNRVPKTAQPAESGSLCSALDMRHRAEALARRFHETYERLAPSHGYETRKASAVPWDDVPEKNKSLMIAVCAELLPHIDVSATQST